MYVRRWDNTYLLLWCSVDEDMECIMWECYCMDSSVISSTRSVLTDYFCTSRWARAMNCQFIVTYVCTAQVGFFWGRKHVSIGGVVIWRGKSNHGKAQWQLFEGQAGQWIDKWWTCERLVMRITMMVVCLFLSLVGTDVAPNRSLLPLTPETCSYLLGWGS